ncbi:MAG: YkgJ family cysteine cluster protein [Dehalococcoidia bacterium]|nr:YkgJ family cysteine cluster protein [Dehalococcoidia bacterium]
MLQAFVRLRGIHKEFSQAAAALEEGIGRPICYERCGLCCEHNTPMMTAIEAVNAVSVLTGLGKLQDAVSRAKGWLEESDPRLTIREGMPIGVARPELRDEWRTVTLSQCPFLDADKRCSIWQVRPMACRAFNVTRDGSEICPRPLGKGETLTRRMVVDGQPIRQMWEDFRRDAKAENPEWTRSGLAPSMLLRAAREGEFREMADRVPSAKLIGLDVDTSLMWQPQLDALKKGVSPDMVVMGGS